MSKNRNKALENIDINKSYDLLEASKIVKERISSLE